MIGLLGGVCKNLNLKGSDFDYFGSKPFLYNNLNFGDFFISRKLNSKFQLDKVFEENLKLAVAVDGVIINSVRLQKKYDLKSNFDLIEFLYFNYGEGFINELKGDFSLVLFDKEQKTLLVYTNLITSKPIYYHHDEQKGRLFFGSNSYELSCLLKNNDVEYSINKSAFYSVITFHYIMGDSHFVDKIKKLKGGTYLKFNTDLNISKYSELSNFPENEGNIENQLELLNENFEENIRLQFDKDKEYEYGHLSTLSGGLDSRMTTLVAHKLGYENIDTITFSSKGYWDEIISKNICRKFNLKNINFQLINGNYLKDYETTMRLDGGVIPYFIAHQMVKFYETIDFKNYGLVHTGQVGDAIIGNTIMNSAHHFKFDHYQPSNYIYFNKMEDIVCEQMKEHDTFELTKFYNHVNNFTMSGNQYIYPFTESVSPFLEKDFINFCLKIPVQLRNSHHAYYEWIKRYNRNLGTFFYEKTRRITIPYSNRIFNKLYNILKTNYYRFLGLKENNNSLLNFKLWLKDEQLSIYFDDLFQKNIGKVDNEELNDLFKELYSNSNPIFKMSAIHCVLVYQLYFDSNNR